MNEIVDKNFIITDAAAKRINQQVKKQQNVNLFLRIIVESGGCSGFKYIFKFTDENQEDDKTFLHQEAKVIIDELSLSLISGSQLDYVETLGQAGFEIKNPNAKARCGCGTSFSL
jgi:iron-sulfur cluster insertion protein